MILAFEPTRSEGVSGIQGTFVFHTNRWSGAQTQLHQARRIIALVLAPSGGDIPHKITSCQWSDFDRCFAAAVSDQIRACCVDQSSGDFDAPFSERELVRALAQCSDSAIGRDGLPYSAFQVNLDWWRQMMLDFFNLVLAWNIVLSAWTSGEVVPVFKHGDRNQTIDRSLWLHVLSKVFERLVHGRIAPHILPQLDESQG